MDAPQCTAFEGADLIATGDLQTVALQVKSVLHRGERAPVLIFDDITSEQIEIDFRGTDDDLHARLSQPPLDEPRRGPGRPKLGVVAREVTLLPRHWEWLNSQPGGASVALRKLVEEARRGNEAKDRQRTAQESTYKFLAAIAGNEPGYEEALRALFAPDAPRFHALIAPWPHAVRDHAAKLAARAFAEALPAKID